MYAEADKRRRDLLCRGTWVAALAILLALGCRSTTGDDDTTPQDDDDTTAGDDDSAMPDDDSADDDSADDDDSAQQALPFCPTHIDVFGYSNVEFTGCGGCSFPGYEQGVTPPDEVLATGTFLPGAHLYDNTLAGRLQALVTADEELTAAFGTDWQVRSCCDGGGHIGAFINDNPIEDGACEESPPPHGRLIAMCSEEPAPLHLLVASNIDDRCHGGMIEESPEITDEPELYRLHTVERLAAYLREREPEMILVSPMHEWHPQQRSSHPDPLAGCEWVVPDWNRQLADDWLEHAPEVPVEPIFIGTMQDEFTSHHICCAVLDDVVCDTDWFDSEELYPDGDGWVHFGCEGSAALADFWLDALKDVLLNNEFTCE